jgi:hypothetical protein
MQDSKSCLFSFGTRSFALGIMGGCAEYVDQRLRTAGKIATNGLVAEFESIGTGNHACSASWR